MFEKIEIKKADNGFILYIDRGVSHIGLVIPPKVFTTERALIKELRFLLKNKNSLQQLNATIHNNDPLKRNH